MPSTLPSYLTIGELARQLNESIHRVEYVIKSREITPIGVAGNARVFSDEQVEQIADALRSIDAKREGR